MAPSPTVTLASTTAGVTPTVIVTFVGALGGAAQNTLSSANSLTGVSGGSGPGVSVGSTTAGFSSAVTVGSGGLLGGTGTTGPVTVTAGGTVNPGEPAIGIGTLSINSAIGAATTLDLSGGGNLTLEVAAFTTPGTSYDQLKLTGLGILKLGGTSSLTLDVSGLTGDGTAPAVVLFSGLEGTFSSVNLIDNPLNLSAILTYKAGELDITFVGTATQFVVSGPASTIAGVPLTFTVTALDQFGNPATTYAGTIHFTSTDSNAGVILPANVTLAAGTGSFSATLITATKNGLTPAAQTITATDSSFSHRGRQPDHYRQSGSGHPLCGQAPRTSVAAGDLLVFSVTAQDAFNNIATGYAGSVKFTSGDAQAALPLNKILTSGAGFFAASLHTAGNQTISATDAASAAITGISNNISVSAGGGQSLWPHCPSQCTPGTAFSVTVAAQDLFNNTVGGYAGTVHFTSTDASATLPLDATLASGTGTFSVTLRAAGSQTISARDTSSPTITGSRHGQSQCGQSEPFPYQPPSSRHGRPWLCFHRGGQGSIQQHHNRIHRHGPFHEQPDGQADLPTDATLTNGVGFFAGGPTHGGPPDDHRHRRGFERHHRHQRHHHRQRPRRQPPRHLRSCQPAITGTAFSFTVKAQDQFGNSAAGYSGTVHFTSSDPGGQLAEQHRP